MLKLFGKIAMPSCNHWLLLGHKHRPPLSETHSVGYPATLENNEPLPQVSLVDTK